MSHAKQLQNEDLTKLLELVRRSAVSAQRNLESLEQGAYEDKDGNLITIEDGSFAATYMAESVVSAYRCITYAGERIRRTLQPTWQGFEVGDDLLREAEYGPQPPLPKDEQPTSD